MLGVTLVELFLYEHEMCAAHLRADTDFLPEHGVLVEDTGILLSLNREEPVIGLLSPCFRNFIPSVARLIREVTGPFFHALLLAEKGPTRQRSQDEKSCTINDIHLSFVNHIDLVDFYSCLDDSLEAAIDLDMQVRHDLRDKLPFLIAGLFLK